MLKRARAALCSLLFGATVFLAAARASQQHGPTVPQVSAWLSSELPVGSTKAQAIDFFKRHGIESDGDVKSVAGYGLRVMVGSIATTGMGSPIARCAIEVALTFDTRLHVSTRQARDTCSR